MFEFVANVESYGHPPPLSTHHAMRATWFIAPLKSSPCGGTPPTAGGCMVSGGKPSVCDARGASLDVTGISTRAESLCANGTYHLSGMADCAVISLSPV